MSVMSNWCQTDKQRRIKFAKKPTTSALRVLRVLRAMWQNDEIYQGKCHESFKRISKAIQDEELGHSIQNSSDTGVLSVALGRTLQSWRDSIDIQQAKEATCLRPYQEFREWHLEIGIAAFLQVSELRSSDQSFIWGRSRSTSFNDVQGPANPQTFCARAQMSDVFISRFCLHQSPSCIVGGSFVLSKHTWVQSGGQLVRCMLLSEIFFQIEWLPCLQTAVDVSKDSRSMHLPIWSMCFAESCCSSRTMPLWSYLSCPLSHFI